MSANKVLKAQEFMEIHGEQIPFEIVRVSGEPTAAPQVDVPSEGKPKPTRARFVGKAAYLGKQIQTLSRPTAQAARQELFDRAYRILGPVIEAAQVDRAKLAAWNKGEAKRYA